MRAPERTVALLRGVNVGGRNLLPMPELRAAVEALGAREVSTYIQSGNVVFRPARPLAAAELEAAIRSRFGLEAAVVLRTASELERVLAANPFPAADPRTIHVGFLLADPAPAVRRLELESFAPERAALIGRELYLELPAGMGRARLPAHLGRRLGAAITYRNWATVTRLAEMAR